MEILTAEQMRQVDRRTIRRYGVPELVLMEQAGQRVFEFLLATYPDLRRRRILFLCGRGNNGGDGFVAARHLRHRGIPIQVVLLGRLQEVRGSAAVHLGALRALGVPIRGVSGEASWRAVRPWLRNDTLIIDAVLGTGLTRPLSGFLARVVEEVGRSGAEVVSVDIPSGLSGSDADLPGPSFGAAHTVTFARPKIPHVFPPARDRCGRVHVADISIPDEAVAAEQVQLLLADPSRLAATLPRRRRDSHKGDFGHVLLVAGSRGKGGAARLAALAALRAGAGLVTAAVPAGLQRGLVGSAMEVMTEALEETADGSLAWSGLNRILGLLPGKRVLAIGPGLTTHPETKKLVRALVRRSTIPVVLDADGLNAFAGAAGRLTGRRRPLILTPHPGEMAGLLGVTSAVVQSDRVGVARRFSRRQHCHLVLKGHLSLIARPDGRVIVNPTGNAGMATAGSGDVLTGILAGFVAQGLAAADAACLSAYLHGLAGDLAAGRSTQAPLLARDILSHLPQALRQLRDKAPGSAALAPCA